VPALVSTAAEPVVALVGRRRTVVVGGGIAYAAALGLFAGSPTFLVLLLATVVLYPASGAFVSLSQATLIDADPAESERSMVRWTLAGAAGALAGPVAVVAALRVDAGWRTLFLAFGACSLLLALSLRRRAFPAGGDDGLGAGARAAWDALRRRDVLLWLVLLQAADLVGDTLLGYLALYLVDDGGLAPAAGALAVGLWTGAGLAGTALTLGVLRRLDGLRVVRVTAAAAAVVYAAFLLAPPPVKLALLLPLGALAATWYPLLMARLYASMPGRSGAVVAISSLAGPLDAVPPLLLGAVADRAGLDAALWLLLAGPLFLAVLRPQRSRR